MTGLAVGVTYIPFVTDMVEYHQDDSQPARTIHRQR